MIVKLTDEHGQTHGQTQWGAGVRHTAPGSGTVLCTPDVIHYYEDERVAVFANPIHANYLNPQMWEFTPDQKVAGDALKAACKSGVTLRRVPLPAMTIDQRVAVAIKCALLVYRVPSFVTWAKSWLSGSDRTAAAANAAANAAYHAAYDAAYDAYDAYAAANAAYYAAYAAAYYAAYHAANAAYHAAYAAYYAAYAAARAANAADILRIILEVK